MKTSISLKSALPFAAEASADLLNLPSLLFSKSGSPSNANSTMSTVFRISTNQTHLKIAGSYAQEFAVLIHPEKKWEKNISIKKKEEKLSPLMRKKQKIFPPNRRKL